jgi:hypothetical protein
MLKAGFVVEDGKAAHHRRQAAPVDPGIVCDVPADVLMVTGQLCRNLRPWRSKRLRSQIGPSATPSSDSSSYSTALRIAGSPTGGQK